VFLWAWSLGDWLGPFFGGIFEEVGAWWLLYTCMQAHCSKVWPGADPINHVCGVSQGLYG
jgi:hypothetical protein